MFTRPRLRRAPLALALGLAVALAGAPARAADDEPPAPPSSRFT